MPSLRPVRSHLHLTTEPIADDLHIFQPEPGSSLATAIAEQRSSTRSCSIEKKRFTPIGAVSSDTSNKDSEIQSLNESDNLKYKTELCRNFSNYGSCSYSSRCQFAHGYEELRCRTRHPKYKTEPCRNFLTGHCKYGSRCQFLHAPDQNKDALTDPTAGIKLDLCRSATTLGTYLLTNMLAQTTAFGFGGSMVHQSALAALVACETHQSKLNFPLENCSLLQRTAMPFQCGIEMQQSSPYPRLHFYHELPISQNQNNNEPCSSPPASEHLRTSSSKTDLRRMGKPSSQF